MPVRLPTELELRFTSCRFVVRGRLENQLMSDCGTLVQFRCSRGTTLNRYYEAAMLAQLYKGFQLFHGVLLALSAAGFFIFWTRTRFWLPMYAHILAAVGLVVGVWCVSKTPDDAPINKEGPTGKFLLALAVPTIVYFFFVFYGGQKAAFKSRFEKSTKCRYCKMRVTVHHGGSGTADPITSEAQQQCPHCGQPLT